MWHCDGYDKLKPFGIAIHGCIDGYVKQSVYLYNTCAVDYNFLCRYSRRIMWLSASRSNNRPDYVAKLFISCVRNVGGKLTYTITMFDIDFANALINATMSYK